MQSSFLLHLTNHGIRKGFSRLYMTSGEGDARPVPLFPVDHDDPAAITDHAHIGKFNRFDSLHYVPFLFVCIRSVAQQSFSFQ